MTTSPSETLFVIERQLQELVAAREECETDEERKVVDGELQRYITAEIKKVDGIASYIRYCQSQEDAADAEIDRLKARREVWKNRRERLRMGVLAVMQTFGERKLDGKTATLAIRLNPPSVITSAIELIPSEFTRNRIVADGEIWKMIVKVLQQAGLKIPDLRLLVETEPKKSEIAGELKRGRPVGGCRLEQTERLDVK